MKLLIKQQRHSGFFSDFNLIVSSLLHCYKNNITDYNIIWNNWRYQDDQTKNLYDDVFVRQTVIEMPDSILHVDALEEVKIWAPFVFANKSIFAELNNILTHIKYFENPIYNKMFDIAKVQINKCCLGVHARYTDSTQHRPYLPITDYFNAIETAVRKNKSINSLFVATDDEKVLEQIINRYGEKTVIYNKNIIRSTTGQGLHLDPTFPYKHKLMEDVILDGVCISLCNEVIHTASNVIGYSLMLNPECRSNQIDKHLPHY